MTGKIKTTFQNEIPAENYIYGKCYSKNKTKKPKKKRRTKLILTSYHLTESWEVYISMRNVRIL